MKDLGTDPVLLEEIVLGDLIREIGLEASYKIGYYEGQRLWLIFDELKARDLQNQWRIMDAANANEEYRNNVSGWLEASQPRRYPRQDEQMPPDVWARIKAAWDAEEMKKNG